MFQEKIQDEIIEFVEQQLKKYNFGKRGYADGDYNEQRTGLIGQTKIQDLFNCARLDGENGFDDGIDFIFSSRAIDVKTMGRTVDPKLTYVNNFMGLQKDYKSDTIIFCSFNKKTNILTICGWITKKELLSKAFFYKKGTKRFRTDGTSFITKTDLYEIENTLLNSPVTLKQLIEDIKTIKN